MKALVTGGAGFIGSHICEELVKEGHEVISVDNYSAGKRKNLKHLKGKIKEENCSILNSVQLEEYFPVDVIYHQAASKKNICIRDPRMDLDVNAHGTFNLLELAVKHKVKKFVHASTGSVYGEAQFFPQDESHPLNPCSYYGVSKLAGERYVRVFKELHGLDVCILRYFHVYGARQDSGEFGGVVSIFLEKIKKRQPITIFGDGSQERSFTYVKDVVKANMLAPSGVYNCASGITVTINDLVRILGEVLGIEPVVEFNEWTPGDIKYFSIDNRKLREQGVDFIMDFKEGLRRTISD